MAPSIAQDAGADAIAAPASAAGQAGREAGTEGGTEPGTGADCVAAPERSTARPHDIDGDGADELVVPEGRELVFYAARGRCHAVVARVPLAGRFAFLYVSEKASEKGETKRDIAVDTWLYHGDRKRVRYSFRDGVYVETGTEQLIEGPRSKRR